MVAEMPKGTTNDLTRHETEQVGKSGLHEPSVGAMTDHPVTLRLPAKLLEQVDELLPLVADDIEFAAMGRVSRSQVLRIAVLQGVWALQERFGLQSKRSSSK